ncbi:arginyltransferase [Lysobacteraceae bacterium NML120232]|nr:arginyltransferase [Xanthomonadaceae bacterium NML120232]
MQQAQSSSPEIGLYLTGERDCGYWPARRACDLVLAPKDPRLAAMYPRALELGFRRSGSLVYRPACPHCSACISVRIPVAKFRPNRSQRRNWQQNADLHLQVRPARQSDEQFALYRRYLASRHAGGGMDAHTPEDFAQFLVTAQFRAHFFELRDGERLLATAVTDVLPDALSSVYTFYAPEAADRGLGTHAILRQIRWAAENGLSHVYLGFWLQNHPKMDYKRRFMPLEGFDGQQWLPFEHFLSELS